MELKIYDAKGAQHTLTMNENAMRDMRAEDGLNAVPLDKFFENQIVKATGDVTAVPDGKGHPTVLNQIAAQMGVNPRSTLKEVMSVVFTLPALAATLRSLAACWLPPCCCRSLRIRCAKTVRATLPCCVNTRP